MIKLRSSVIRLECEPPDHKVPPDPPPEPQITTTLFTNNEEHTENENFCFCTRCEELGLSGETKRLFSHISVVKELKELFFKPSSNLRLV